MPNSEFSKDTQTDKLQQTLRMERHAKLEDRMNSGYQQASFPSSAEEAIDAATRRLQQEKFQ